MSSPLPPTRLSFSLIDDAGDKENAVNTSKPMAAPGQATNTAALIKLKGNNNKQMVKRPLMKIAASKLNENHHGSNNNNITHVHPKMSNANQNVMNRLSDIASQEANVSVFLRIRPATGQNTTDDTNSNTLIPVSATEVESIAPSQSQAFKNRKNDKKYSFTKVFSPESNQQDIFNYTTKKLVDDFVSGKDGLLFTYGVTNSGKTYTIEGTQQQPGIIPRVLETLFEREQFNSNKVLKVSYLQVYNEQIHDLQDLTPEMIAAQSSKQIRDDMSEWNQPMGSTTNYMAGTNIVNQRRNLKIKTLDDRTIVENLKSTEIKSIDDGLRILSNGRALRETQETALNSLSSRSHSAYILEIYERETVVTGVGEEETIETKEILKNRLFIVDLAGSERGKRTNTNGIRQKEAMNINLSLMILDRCLETIRDNQKLLKEHPERKPMRVPYRDSILTMIFRECFTSYNNISMIVCASSNPQDFDETARALEYGALTKDINIIHQKVNTKPPPVVSNHIPFAKPVRHDIKNNKNQSEQTTNQPNIVKSKFNLPKVANSKPGQEPQKISQHQQQPNPVNVSHQATEYGQINVDQHMDVDIVKDSEKILRLRDEITELKSANARLEEEIRREVTNEMAARIIELDQIYQKRLEEATMIGEERAKMMNENLKKRNTDKVSMRSQTPHPKRATLISKYHAYDVGAILENDSQLEAEDDDDKKEESQYQVKRIDDNTKHNQELLERISEMEMEINSLQQALVDKETEIQTISITYSNQIHALNKELDATRRKMQEAMASSSSEDKYILGDAANNLIVVDKVNKAVLEVENTRLNNLYQVTKAELIKLQEFNSITSYDMETLKAQNQELVSLLKEMNQKLMDEERKSAELVIEINKLEMNSKAKKNPASKLKRSKKRSPSVDSMDSLLEQENDNSKRHNNDNNDDDIADTYEPKFKKTSRALQDATNLMTEPKSLRSKAKIIRKMDETKQYSENKMEMADIHQKEVMSTKGKGTGRKKQKLVQ